jgi:hypothetical protein
MQLKKLVKDYVLDEISQNLFKFLKFLPFVPAKHFIKTFKKNNKKPMLVYFETFSIGKLIIGSTTVRKLPVYPLNNGWLFPEC